jgi:phage-related protein (TIGR01555 family)
VTTPAVLAVEADPFPSARQDGWQNSFTGYGTWRDKTIHAYHALGLTLTDEELSSLYYTEDIAAKIVEKRPEEAFRRGYCLKDSDDEEGAAELAQLGRDLDVDGKFQEAWTWARCWGGSLVIIGTEGGGSMAAPLKEESVRAVRFLNVVDRRQAEVVATYQDPLHPNYGQPLLYRIQGLDSSSAIIHESRVIRFDGVKADPRKRIELQGWGYSVLQRPYDVMRQFATSFAAAGVLTADASQAVFKMKGLMQMIASGEKQRLQTRMQLVDMSRSAARAVLLDADGEEFQRIATSFSGLPEMLDRFAMRLAASIDMPVTLLMGRSPAGENATGASDFKHWYDSIASEQKKSLTPKLVRFYRILSRGKAKKLAIEWHPLQEPTEREKAEIEKIKTDTRSSEIKDGVLFAEEVALAKYGKNTNGEIVIDEKVRKQSLEMEKELALNPPPEPAPGGQNGGAIPSTGSSATGAGPSGNDSAPTQ